MVELMPLPHIYSLIETSLLCFQSRANRPELFERPHDDHFFRHLVTPSPPPLPSTRPRHTLLFKGSEDLRLDQRIMQLLRVVNAMLSPVARPTDGLRAHHYGVVPIAPRAGLIEWVDDANSLFSFYKVGYTCWLVCCNRAPRIQAAGSRAQFTVI